MAIFNAPPNQTHLVLNVGDILDVNRGGLADHTTINNGGVENVLFRGQSDNTTINFGGVENDSDGEVHNTTINNGGVENLIRGESQFTMINGGVENVLATGTSGSTTINTGGVENVNSGGTARGTTINTGGVENVSGVSDHTAINKGGAEEVLNGGTADRTTINGGVEIVTTGGTANQTTINNLGIENVSGVSDTPTINNGGLETVSNGGVSEFARIHTGGLEIVTAGGTARNTKIIGVGVETVQNGGTADNVAFSFSEAGGTLNLQNPLGLKGTISFWRVGDVIDFLDTKVTDVQHTGKMLTVTYDDNKTATYTLTSLQNHTRFDLQPDGHGGTKLIVTAAVLRSQPFSPETAGTIVYTAEFGSAPDATELNVLSQFAQAQFAYGQQIGVQDPSVYAFEALGVALASGQHFQNQFGPSNSMYPASAAGDAQFVTDAYASVFGHAGTAAQVQHFSDQQSFFEGLYTAAGTFGSPSNIDLLARGAVYGQMLGIEQESGLVGEPSPAPVIPLTTGQDSVVLDESGSTVNGTFGGEGATWTLGDFIASTDTTDETFNIQGIGAAGVINVTSVPGAHVVGVENVNISAASGQAVQGDFTATGPEGEWLGFAQLTVDSTGSSEGVDNLTVGPDTAVEITDSVTSATNTALTVDGSSTTTVVEKNLAVNAGITVNGGSGTTAVSIAQTESGPGFDGVVNIVDVNGASKTDAGTITNVTLDGLSHFTVAGGGNVFGPNSIVDNVLTDLTINDSGALGDEAGLIIHDNLAAPTTTTLNLNLSHDGVNAAGAGVAVLGITDANNEYSTVHLSLGAENSFLAFTDNGLTTLDTPNGGTGALVATPTAASFFFDDVAAAVNFDFSGLNGPNSIEVLRGATNNPDVYTLGNFGTADFTPGLFQMLTIEDSLPNNTDTINFGSGAYFINDAAHPAARHSYVQTAANGAGVGNFLQTGEQWAIINNMHGGSNSDTLTFKTDNVEMFVNLGEQVEIAQGIDNALLNTHAHTVIEFTISKVTYIVDHADDSFALTAADAMVELTGIHPIAGISVAHEITFTT